MTQNCNGHGSGGQYSQTVAAALERPRYSPGLILEDSDLTSAVDYTRSLSRLLFRNLFGCGVICGLTVKIDTDCGLNVTVSPGLALDGCGDPVQLPSPVTIAFDKKKAEQITKDASPFWVTLCGKEKMCQPRALLKPTVAASPPVRLDSSLKACVGPASSRRPAAAPSARPWRARRSPLPLAARTSAPDCTEDCGAARPAIAAAASCSPGWIWQGIWTQAWASAAWSGRPGPDRDPGDQPAAPSRGNRTAAAAA